MGRAWLVDEAPTGVALTADLRTQLADLIAERFGHQVVRRRVDPVETVDEGR